MLDVNQEINFAALGYQESHNNYRNFLLIYDIAVGNIVKRLQINPRTSCIPFMFVDHMGFNNFKVVRTSDVKDYNSTYGDKDARSFISDDL